jgi:hypothetical protein
VLVFVALMLSMGARHAAADEVKTQAPCTDPCISLGAGTDGVFTARKISFNAAGPGKAIVTFQGTLHCLSNNPNFTNFSIQTQIVKKQDPSGAGPGGLELFISTEPYDGNSRSFTINLASQRVFEVRAAGRNTYRFRVRRGFLAVDTACSVRGGALTIHFVSSGLRAKRADSR